MFQPLVENGSGVALHGHKVAELATFDLDMGEPLAGILVAVELQDLRNEA